MLLLTISKMGGSLEGINAPLLTWHRGMHPAVHQRFVSQSCMHLGMQLAVAAPGLAVDKLSRLLA